jgi:iron complex transport system substrate-binding protein
VSRRDLRALAPDVVVIKPCGFPLERTLEEVSLLPAALPWESWPAVREGRVCPASAGR